MDLFAYLLGKKAGLKSATKVIANPELAGTEEDLTGLQVGDEKYKVSEVNANPTLAGTESELTGLEVNGIKYKIDTKEHYSTTEQVVGTWKDGKPLFRKIYTMSAPHTNTNGTYASDFVSIDPDTDFGFIEYGIIKRTNQTITFPVISSAGILRAVIGLETNNKNITVYNSDTGNNDNDLIISVLYTKTTD